MGKKLYYSIFLISLASAGAKDEDLPLCPSNFQFFPQNLPMHCRMPTSADFQGMSGFPTMQPLPDKQPMPAPMPQGIQGQMPGPIPMPMPGPMMPMSGPMMPMSGPMMSMPLPAPNQKLPVIVMPFYSPDTSFKKPARPWRPGPGSKRPSKPHETSETSSDTDTSSDTSDEVDSSSGKGYWKGKKRGWRKSGRRTNKEHRHSHRSNRRHNKKQNNLLTPVLQYVTNDGYVIYEKTISKGEAKDWLRVQKEDHKPEERNESKNNEDLDDRVHVERKTDVEEVNMKRYKSREDDEENNEEREEERPIEVTTPKVHVRRHHRKPAAAAINKLLPQRPF
ncbi:Uncharacterized protein OBRU01_03028 [Operophtera brumata]|uniref:Uncharacterized protein n=1 Tax=Operophtera brumata TaxID=104452 RepID=A0A0L7LRP6_OPEBR|nr:Uncharacterized protein OBRU01_03028 [Operophtera brumata]